MPTLASVRHVTAGPAREPDVAALRWPPATVVLAGAGCAIGLGSVWQLPWLAERHGGGAFVLLYLLAVALLGVPLLATELMLGRCARRNPADSLGRLARARTAAVWALPGWTAIAAAVVVLAIAGVVAGWAFAYLGYAARGLLTRDGTGGAAAQFVALLADPVAVAGWQLAFLGTCAAAAAAGAHRGIVYSARWLVPVLLLLIVLLAASAAAATGRLADAAAALFTPDFARLDASAVFAATRLACFSLGLGAGAMVACGARAPADLALPRTAAAIATLDTAASLLAALAIHALLIAAGMPAREAPGLPFVTLPMAFSALPSGDLLAVLFFLVLLLGALASAVVLFEPVVSLVRERFGRSRGWATLVVAIIAGGLGVAAGLSFSVMASLRLGGHGLFDLLDGAAVGVLMPLAAAGAAIFAAHALPRRAVRAQLGVTSRRFLAWRVLVGWVAPGLLLATVAARLFG